MATLIFISGVVSLVILIVFFMMASNISDTRRNTQTIISLLTGIQSSLNIIVKKMEEESKQKQL